MSLPGSNVVIDISHYSHISSVAEVRADGVAAVICKATEGAHVIDKTYLSNKKLFKDAGFKWGSYHFSSGERPIDQVENYLSRAQPEADELICLDYEPSFSGPNMTLPQMTEFLSILYQETGRHPFVYGGSLLRETLRDQPATIVTQCPLWYAYYPSSSNQPIGIPEPWSDWTLWQYTDGNHGPMPQSVAGIGNCDRSTFNGSTDELLSRWPFT